MIKFFGKPGACSLGPHIALEEAGIPFEYVPVRTGNAKDREELLKYNPLGQVATMVFDDGTILTQNAALLTWIADSAQDEKLLPPFGSFERARANEWLAYLGTTLHPAFGPLFNPRGVTSDESQFDDARKVALERVHKSLAYVEDRLGEGPYVLGSEYSVIDPYLLAMFSWTDRMKIDTQAYPRLRRHTEAVRAREATQRALATERAASGKA